MLPIHYIYSDLSRMRRQLSSHFYSGKVPPMYILQSICYNISTQSFSQDAFPLSDPSQIHQSSASTWTSSSVSQVCSLHGLVFPQTSGKAMQSYICKKG